MPARTPRPCTQPGCGEPAVAGGKCATHKRQQRRHTDTRRGNAASRGYDKTHEQQFRAVVLARDPTCVTPGCSEPSLHADHFPHTRRELEALSLDPNDPRYGRGLCGPHHNQHTALTSGSANNLRRD